MESSIRIEVNEIKILVKRRLSSNKTIVWLNNCGWRLWRERGRIFGCCLRFARDCNNHREHSSLEDPQEERFGLRGIPSLCSCGTPCREEVFVEVGHVLE